jgi:hypothetical protein
MKTSIFLTTLVIVASCVRADGANSSPVRRLPFWHACQPTVVRTAVTAVEATKQRLANVKADSWKRGLTSDEREAMAEVFRANAVDAVLQLQQSCKLATSGRFQAACKAREEEIASLALHDWRQAMPPDRLESTKAVLVAKSIDLADTVLVACGPATPGAFGAACKMHRQALVAISQKDWQRDRLSDEQDAVLQKVMMAYYVDASQSLTASAGGAKVTLPPGDRPHIQALAVKIWSRDAATADETAALCRALAASIGH